jgi:hypothetical protein
MNKTLLAVGGFFGVAMIAALTLVGMYFNYSNAEKRLRNSITAKQVDNKNEMDAMWKPFLKPHKWQIGIGHH